MKSQEEAMKQLIRFAFSDDDGAPDLSLLPEFAEAIRKAKEAAWDEGYEAAGKVVHPGVNPYRRNG